MAPFVSSATVLLWRRHLVCFISVSLPLRCTDPTRSGQEQPDAALLSKAGPTTAPGPGDQHRRAGSGSPLLREAFPLCARHSLTAARVRLSSEVMERLCARVQQQVCVLRGAKEKEEVQAAKQVLKEARNSRAVSGSSD